MKIGGLQKLTLIDYPQRTACTVFLSGCNFRCPWCYSPELVLPEEIDKQPEIKEEELFSFLRNRKGKLDGVVICGGEPTFDPHIEELLKKIKEEGFLVKLDTNGSHPHILKSILEKKLVDYVAMDVKLPLERYKEVGLVDAEKIKESIGLLMNGDVDYEFRTTLVPGVHGKEDILKIAEMIKGAKRYFLQNFLPIKTVQKEFLQKPSFLKIDLERMREVASKFVDCKVRSL